MIDNSKIIEARGSLCLQEETFKHKNPLLIAYIPQRGWYCYTTWPRFAPMGRQISEELEYGLHGTVEIEVICSNTKKSIKRMFYIVEDFEMSYNNHSNMIPDHVDPLAPNNATVWFSKLSCFPLYVREVAF